jgi:hypothetical protein
VEDALSSSRGVEDPHHAAVEVLLCTVVKRKIVKSEKYISNKQVMRND